MANLWSDEQKPHEAIVKDKAAKQAKVQQLLGINYSRCGYWRMAEVLNTIITKEIIAKLGYTSMLDYYLVVCEN